MRRRSATEILTDHARERWLRRAIRSVQLDGDRGAVRRMTEGEWVDSCALTRGVAAELLDVLGVRECEGGGTYQNREAIDLPDRVLVIDTELVAEPLTLEQAARRVGVVLGGADLRKMRMAAIATVSENMMTRRVREGGRAA